MNTSVYNLMFTVMNLFTVVHLFLLIAGFLLARLRRPDYTLVFTPLGYLNICYQWMLFIPKILCSLLIFKCQLNTHETVVNGQTVFYDKYEFVFDPGMECFSGTHFLMIGIAIANMVFDLCLGFIFCRCRIIQHRGEGTLMQ
jgi:hypothetical protein